MGHSFICGLFNDSVSNTLIVSRGDIHGHMTNGYKNLVELLQEKQTATET
jgi:hypothetical protein